MKKFIIVSIIAILFLTCKNKKTNYTKDLLNYKIEYQNNFITFNPNLILKNKKMIDSLRGYISFLKSSCSEDSLKIKNSFIYVNLNHIDTAKLFLVALRINEPFIPPVCYLNLDGYNFLFSLGSRNFTSSDSLLIHNFLKTINKDLIKNIDYEVRKGTNYTRHIRITKDSINFSWRDYENPYFGSGDKLNEMIEMYRNKKKSK